MSPPVVEPNFGDFEALRAADGGMPARGRARLVRTHPFDRIPGMGATWRCRTPSGGDLCLLPSGQLGDDSQVLLVRTLHDAVGAVLTLKYIHYLIILTTDGLSRWKAR
jgi:hypothetical protein